MDQDVFGDTVDTICSHDDRYAPDAYYFMREALDYTSKQLNKPSTGPGRHVSGQELLNGLRAFTLQEFGPMSLSVLNHWGITCTEDFGNIVFNLVESGRLGSTEHDNRNDFANGYTFDEAFAKPFRPNSPETVLNIRRNHKRTTRARRPRNTGESS